jgi:hypothetical protein
MYSQLGRPSIAPEKLLKALLLQVLYTIRSERLLMEQLGYNLLFRWFVGLNSSERRSPSRGLLQHLGEELLRDISFQQPVAVFAVHGGHPNRLIQGPHAAQRVVRRHSPLRREIAEHRALLGVWTAHKFKTLRRESVSPRNKSRRPFFGILLD